MREVLLTSTVLILAIFGLRRLCRGKLNPRWQYALWLPIVLRLLLPITIGNSSLSMLNLLPEQENTDQQGIISTDQQETEKKLDEKSDEKLDGKSDKKLDKQSDKKSEKETDATQDKSDNKQDNRQDNLTNYYDNQQANDFTRFYLIWGIWFIGMVVTGGYLFIYQMRWKRYLRKNRKRCQYQSSYHQLAVYAVKGLPSPCLSGKAIYLTEEMAAEEKNRLHILAHEYCHYRQGDRLWVKVRCLLVSLYWFHPLVWAAAYASKQDSELACDEAALQLLGEEERLAYGQTLLSLAAANSIKQNGIGLAFMMSGGAKGMKQRILRIAKKPKYAAAATAGIAVAVVLLGISAFSGRRQEDTAEPQETAQAAPEEKQELQEIKEITQATTDAEQESREIAQAASEEQQESQEITQAAPEEEQEPQETAQTASDAEQEEQIYALLDEWVERYAPEHFAEAKLLNDYKPAYAEQGEAALEEALYLLDSANCQDGSVLNIYGMYSKQYGCRGILVHHGVPGENADGKRLFEDNCSSFNWQWTVEGVYFAGSDLPKNNPVGSNLVVYEEAENGAPCIFVWKQPIANTSTKELWELHYFFRYDTETLTCLTFDDALSHVKERLRFRLLPEKKQVAVYDKIEETGEEVLAGTIPYDVLLEEAAAEESGRENDKENDRENQIAEAILDEDVLGYVLGEKEGELKLVAAIGLKWNGEAKAVYRQLNLISFPVTCDFEEGKFKLGAAEVEESYVNGIK